MKRDRRTTIGLFVGNIDDAYDGAVTKGVMQGAKEVDANLIIFPGRYLKAQYRDKERSRSNYQYNTVFSYASKQNIDVLLVLMGSIGTMLTEAEKKTFLDSYRDIPVILISDYVDGYPSIVFDNKSGLKEGIEDLILQKKCKKIGFVSGPLTNADAVERLEVYKSTMQEHNLEMREDLIVYGNFSEYSEEIVGALLDTHSDLDAIVCANDQMAIGAYKAIKAIGKKPGDDILVMGFDDSPTAITLVPNLTSVQASAMSLGRVSAIEAVNYLCTKNIRNSKVKTNLVKRRSTGSRSDYKLIGEDIKNFDSLIQEDVLSVAAKIVQDCFGENRNNSTNFDTMISNWIVFVREFFMQIYNDATSKSPGDMESLIEHTITHTDEEIFDPQKVFSLFTCLKDIVKTHKPELADKCMDMVNDYMLHLTALLTRQHKVVNDEFGQVLWMSNSIARDMLTYDEGSDRCYETVADKLQRLGFASSYIYSFQRPFVNIDASAWHDWQVPTKAFLKTYYRDEEEITILPESKQVISTMNLFDNPYMPMRDRYDMVLNIIFINEEQMGLLLCQVDNRKLEYLTSIMAQLSSSFKIINMLNVQTGIQRELEMSLRKIRENSRAMDLISKHDELTGLLNRRGFFDKSSQLIKESRDKNKKAIVIFADLDNLKKINDEYGHGDGDYALESVGEVLKDSMRASDLVARIGGDEFAALAITEAESKGEALKNRVKEIMEKFNENSDKPYYIGISVGYSEFMITQGTALEDYLDLADERLYEDKMHKRKDILK